MEVCGDRCVDIIQEFVYSIDHHNRDRALDMASGDGRLTVDFLLGQYKKVDLFDKCFIAYKKAKAACAFHPSFGSAERCEIEDWEYEFQYSAIYMVWCVGYFTKPKLVKALKDAKEHLIPEKGRISRNRPPESFIFVFDTVLDKIEKSYEDREQRVRHQDELETIFKEADLLIYK